MTVAVSKGYLIKKQAEAPSVPCPCGSPWTAPGLSRWGEFAFNPLDNRMQCFTPSEEGRFVGAIFRRYLSTFDSFM
jgi:hypothetical protein